MKSAKEALGLDARGPTYNCRFRAIEHPIPDMLFQAFGKNVDFIKAAKGLISRALIRHREQEFMDTFMVPGVWSFDYTGSAKPDDRKKEFVYWDHYLDSNPVRDIERAMLDIKMTSGMTPNTMVVSPAILDMLLCHPIVKKYRKYTQDPDQLVTKTFLEILFKLRIVVAWANITDGETASWLFDNRVWIGYINQAKSMLEPSAGYTLVPENEAWNGNVIRFETHRDPVRHVVYAQGFMLYDQVMVSEDLGALLYNVCDEPAKAEPKPAPAKRPESVIEEEPDAGIMLL